MGGAKCYDRKKKTAWRSVGQMKALQSSNISSLDPPAGHSSDLTHSCLLTICANSCNRVPYSS
ncbi:hypothetical protein M413DRAFT_450081 [Hebeloma cylindrosporum]|uniref:Uncharacterized protein n=1 Tax=Hebeloma cylindrosporum TaxID=76867 RepID=A0A0C3BD49_HEBCY|nr:hypothetical protein M413DRAFT_450100 [Hebeloma cylindrosporum h7]KIM34740.1 hypothetical protein M413DRAFT_450081 [Hebeloma cylindrosporum h7]